MRNALKFGLIAAIAFLALGFGTKAVRIVIINNRLKKVLVRWKDLIQKIAKEQKLDWRLLAALVAMESEGNENAYRYEPDFDRSYVTGKMLHRQMPYSKYEASKLYPLVHTAWDWSHMVNSSSPKGPKSAYTFVAQKWLAASHGLVQIMGKFAVDMGFSKNANKIYDPETNLRIGAKALKMHLTRYKGDIAKALSAYNAGTVCSVGLAYAAKVLEYYEQAKAIV